MASHHHFQIPQNPSCRSRCCCCCCCCPSSSPPQILSPPQAVTDSLLQIIASHLLQSPSSNFQSEYIKKQYKQQLQNHQYQQDAQTLILLKSLLDRVAALESSFHNLSPRSSEKPNYSAADTSATTCRTRSLLNLRDLAARKIQTHFRALLVRRSQTLRHLRELARIKSHVASLKSSLANKTLISPHVLSQQVSELLFKLDAIQSRDSQIKEGRRAIRAQLLQLLELIEEFRAECHINLPPKAKKKVSFAECELAIPPPVENPSQVAFCSTFDGIGVYSNVGEVDEDERRLEMDGLNHRSSFVKIPRKNSMSDGSNRVNGNFQRLKSNIVFPSSLSAKNEEVAYESSGNWMSRNGTFDFGQPCAVPMGGSELRQVMHEVAKSSISRSLNSEDFIAGGSLGLSAPVPVQMEKRGNNS